MTNSFGERDTISTSSPHHEEKEAALAHPTLGQIAGKEFYEGRWITSDFSAGSFRNWLVKKERFFLLRLSGKGGRALELGCGGGWKLFAMGRDLVGVDISQASLKAASRIYPSVALAHLAQLPFPDETFDLVLSSDVLGHIPTSQKNAVLGDIYRVLKKGGRTLHYIEADGNDPITRYAKGFPDLYKRHFVETEGHEGLESFPDITARFRAAGFLPKKEISAYKMLAYIERVPLLYDNEYAANSRAIAALVTLCKLLIRFWPLGLAANLALALTMEITDRLFPSHWASGVMVEYEK